MFFKNQKSSMARLVLIVILLGGIFGHESTNSAHAATLIVTNTNDSGTGSLRQAAINAVSGDTITFAPSLAGQTIVLTSEINLNKDLTIDASTLDPTVELSGNLASRIFYVSSNSTVTLVSLLLKDGRSTSASGGAIYSEGNLVVNKSTFINNVATTSGGAIFGSFSMDVSNSTFVSNRAQSGGAIYLAGGIFSNPESHRSIVNSTFVSNQADPVNGQGGGVFNYGSTGFEPSGSAFILSNNTFSGNGANAGGNLYNWGSMSFNNNIFADNTSGGDCYSMGSIYPIIVYGVNNLIEDGVSCSQGTFISGDPLLGPLADNGGPTMTMALLPGSPAIDAGTAACGPADQRGITRPQGAACEIGAYEYEYQTVIYHVKWDASGANNGTSWTNAFTDLQSALAAASTGDQIWVAAGTYKPTMGTDRTISFALKSGVAIYGGFAGTETLLSQRNYGTNLTTLSGDIGAVADNSDNSYHVVIGSNTNNYARLDGFTVTGGNANGSSASSERGGGMYNFHGSPSLANLIFTNNYARFGGGMNNESTSLLDSSNPKLSNVSFISNSATEGGGMRNMSYSSPTLDNVKFQNNTVPRAGGGMANVYQNNVMMHNVEFSGNVAGVGGGMTNVYSNPIMVNATFSHNSAEWGGAIANGGSSPTIINATFYGNSAITYGGAISNEYSSSPTLTNVTISGNSAASYAGGIYNESNGGEIRNSILYGNIGGEIFSTSGDAVVSYSVVQGGYPGTSNLNTDPLLLPLADNGGFTQTMALGAGSPAIDAGQDVTCPSTDQRDVARPQGSHCDMGAYEYVFPPTPTPTRTPKGTLPTPTNAATRMITPTSTPITPTATHTYTPHPPTVTFTPSLTTTATNVVSTPADLVKSFSPISITSGGISRLSVLIFNPNLFALTSTSLADNLPAGMTIANPVSLSNSCGGTVSAVAGGTNLSISGGTVPAQVGSTPGSCTVAINVTSSTPGNFTNTIPSGALSTGNGVTNTSSAAATLTVLPSVATNTATPPRTPTNTPKAARTSTASSTPLPTNTATRTATSTMTAIHTFTPTPTATFTLTATRTASPTVTSTASSGFPITVVRDNFNRANGAIGSNWSGYPSAFSIASNQLDVTATGSNTYILWNAASFGTDQEAYVTLTQINTAGTSEHRLILKSQSNKNVTTALITVLYDGLNQNVQVWTYHSTQGWVQQGASIPVAFVNGDQLGARARPDGTVDVYRNGTLLATRSVTSWPYYNSGGYIGLWLVNAPNALLDNFGGGTR